MPDNKKIYLARPTLPPFEELVPSLKEIWERGWLTNFGPEYEKFEHALAEHLGTPNVSLVNNGTTGLILALRGLGLSGDVITTPYTFVATASSILWAGLRPIFVDIDPNTLNIDPVAIENAITPETSAILAVHAFGHPCDIKRIMAIGQKHELKVIFDAAHTFGAEIDGHALANYGDASALSFHATKGFNTFEGGAVCTSDSYLKRRIDTLTNFGISDDDLVGLGLNGKMNEFCAALGMAQLPYLAHTIECRRRVAAKYDQLLVDIPGIKNFQTAHGTEHNFLYYPIALEDGHGRSPESVIEEFKKHNIDARRYFYPLLSEYPAFQSFCPNAKNELVNAYKTAERIICLPMFAELTDEDLDRITQIIMSG